MIQRIVGVRSLGLAAVLAACSSHTRLPGSDETGGSVGRPAPDGTMSTGGTGTGGIGMAGAPPLTQAGVSGGAGRSTVHPGGGEASAGAAPKSGTSGVAGGSGDTAGAGTTGSTGSAAGAANAGATGSSAGATSAGATGNSAGATNAGGGSLSCDGGGPKCIEQAPHECANGRWVRKECPVTQPLCYKGECAECLPGNPQCTDTLTLKTCQDGVWTSRTCQGNTPVCYNTDCVQCLPGTAKCDGFNLLTCAASGTWAPSACANGCWNDRCLTQPARTTAGVVQCDRALLCPTDKVCCYNKSTHLGTCETQCVSDDQYGAIACDGDSDCAQTDKCCSTRYEGIWQSTSCGQCKSPVSEVLIRPTCTIDSDCGVSSCKLEEPTTTILVCQ